MVLSVGSSVVMSNRKSTAGTPSLRKYFQRLQVNDTLSIQVELPGHLYGHDFSYRPRNHTRGLQR